MTRLRGIRADIREMGLSGWLIYATDRALGRLFRGRAGLHVLRFYVQPVQTQALTAKRSGDSFTVGTIGRDLVPEAAFDRPPGVIAERFDDGGICIAALKQDELAGFMWLQRGVLRERIVRCRLHALPLEHVEWDYDFYIQPRYRLGRLFARLWDAAAADLRERGVSATLSWVHLHNRASANAHARLGSKPIGWAMFLVAFEHQLMITSMRPKVDYSLPGRTTDLYVDASPLLRDRA